MFGLHLLHRHRLRSMDIIDDHVVTIYRHESGEVVFRIIVVSDYARATILQCLIVFWIFRARQERSEQVRFNATIDVFLLLDLLSSLDEVHVHGAETFLWRFFFQQNVLLRLVVDQYWLFFLICNVCMLRLRLAQNNGLHLALWILLRLFRVLFFFLHDLEVFAWLDLWKWFNNAFNLFH